MNVVVGVDGGGTNTRVLITDLQGRFVGAGRGRSGTVFTDPEAATNVQDTIRSTLRAAAVAPAQVRVLVAGLAGCFTRGGAQRREGFLQIDGLSGERHLVNDTLIGLVGALSGRAGIVGMAGSFAAAAGVCPDGTPVDTNFDFGYKTRGSGALLVGRVVHRILMGAYGPDDASLVASLREALAAPDDDTLFRVWREAVRGSAPFVPWAGRHACLVTEAAAAGVPMAREVCALVIADVVDGVRLVASRFPRGRLLCSYMGSVLRAPYMADQFRAALAHPDLAARFEVIPPALAPAAGAVWMALRRAGVAPGLDTMAELARTYERASDLWTGSAVAGPTS